MTRADRKRRQLVDLLRTKGISDARVLDAIGVVPRHAFMDDGLHHQAYDDLALPIGLGQTISQPFTVARMTELAAIQPGDRVLEVGTGSGYQAAILVEMGARVFSVERHAPILDRTKALFRQLEIRVRTRLGDGSRGWPAYAPYDAILVTAGGAIVPDELVEQLRPPKPGRPDARMIIPVGGARKQVLHRITRVAEKEAAGSQLVTETFDGVVFVPLVRDP